MKLQNESRLLLGVVELGQKDEGSNLYPLLFKTIVKKAGEKLSQE